MAMTEVIAEADRPRSLQTYVHPACRGRSNCRHCEYKISPASINEMLASVTCDRSTITPCSIPSTTATFFIWHALEQTLI